MAETYVQQKIHVVHNALKGLGKSFFPKSKKRLRKMAKFLNKLAVETMLTGTLLKIFVVVLRFSLRKSVPYSFLAWGYRLFS